VAELRGGDVVVVPFPFTDLQSSKRRPALVLATFARGDLLICQRTSRSESHPTAVAIGGADFMQGRLDRTSSRWR
jgi:mRNA interferase MazF